MPKSIVVSIGKNGKIQTELSGFVADTCFDAFKELMNTANIETKTEKMERTPNVGVTVETKERERI